MSEGLSNHISTNYDQYGPCRIGPSYPFILFEHEDDVQIPTVPYAHFGGNHITFPVYGHHADANGFDLFKSEEECKKFDYEIKKFRTAEDYYNRAVEILGKKENAVEKIKEISLGGKGANFIVETAGSPAALKDSIACAARYARISIVSFYERNLDDLPIDPIVLGCFSLVGAAGRYGNAPEVCEIMRKNPVKLTPIVTHHIPFAETIDIFENEEKYHATKIKAMITFDE